MLPVVQSYRCNYAVRPYTLYCTCPPRPSSVVAACNFSPVRQKNAFGLTTSWSINGVHAARTLTPTHTDPSSQNSRKASKHQSKTVSLRLSPNHGLAHARNHSSHAPRTQPAPNGAPPTPAPRAQRTYSFCTSDGRLAAACDATQRTAAHTAAPAVPTTGALQV